ncbi:hypothetical protein MRY87_05195 [bacterium]|nr:hypothetical protein [bacterium]
MTISKQFMELLCCPATHQPLREVSPTELSRLQQEGGQELASLEGALIREDQAVLYPIRDGIPVLITEEAISLSRAEHSPA